MVDVLATAAEVAAVVGLEMVKVVDHFVVR